MTMEWSSGLNWNWHKTMCSQVCLDVCYMEGTFVFCYNTDNAAKKTYYEYRQSEGGIVW